MSAPEPIAQVCLYGAREVGYAYLASGPELSSPIVAEGGWSPHDPSSPSGEYRTLSEAIERAKVALRALGMGGGEVLVCFPGGERCARTPLDRYERAGEMRLEPAPIVAITREAIDAAGRALADAAPRVRRPASASSPGSSGTRSAARPRARRAPPLGRTSSGKRLADELDEAERRRGLR